MRDSLDRRCIGHTLLGGRKQATGTPAASDSRITAGREQRRGARTTMSSWMPNGLGRRPRSSGFYVRHTSCRHSRARGRFSSSAAHRRWDGERPFVAAGFRGSIAVTGCWARLGLLVVMATAIFGCPRMPRRPVLEPMEMSLTMEKLCSTILAPTWTIAQP